MIDVRLAQCFSQIAVSIMHTPPPTRLVLFLTGQRVAEEIKVLIHKRLAQKWRGPVNRPPAQICLPMREGMIVNQFLFSPEEIRRGDDVVIAGRSLYRS